MEGKVGVHMLRTFSFGGGVQSTAALVLAVQGEIDYPTFLFCNTGDDSEDPATLDYVTEHAGPYAERHGIALHELRYPGRTLYQRLTTLGPQGGQFIGIPFRLGETGKPGKRSCTDDYKVTQIHRWQKARGATASDPALTGLGISLDEMQRERTPIDPARPEQRRDYPLIRLRLTRQDCVRIIERAGLPVPPKSACWFCPYKSRRRWQELRDYRPALFDQAVDLEAGVNARRAARGLGPVWLTDDLVPLDQATSPHRQLPMFMDDTEDACESGYCMV